MTPHTAPLLFVATEGGLARYLGAPRTFRMLEPHDEYQPTWRRRDDDQRAPRDAAPRDGEDRAGDGD
jgi:hypothetical protein